MLEAGDRFLDVNSQRRELVQGLVRPFIERVGDLVEFVLAVKDGSVPFLKSPLVFLLLIGSDSKV